MHGSQWILPNRCFRHDLRGTALHPSVGMCDCWLYVALQILYCAVLYTAVKLHRFWQLRFCLSAPPKADCHYQLLHDPSFVPFFLPSFLTFLLQQSPTSYRNFCRHRQSPYVERFTLPKVQEEPCHAKAGPRSIHTLWTVSPRLCLVTVSRQSSYTRLDPTNTLIYIPLGSPAGPSKPSGQELYSHDTKDEKATSPECDTSQHRPPPRLAKEPHRDPPCSSPSLAHHGVSS